jgi:hypothetical protein
LKFLLDQRLSTVPQHQWISKLFGYDFDVMYHPGCLNVVADAFSRRDTEEGSTSFGSALCVRSGPSFTFIDDIRRATSHADDAKDVCRRFEAGELQGPWRIDDGLLLHGNRIYVPGHADLRHQALSLAHSAGHEGIQKTLHRLRADFYIPDDRALRGTWCAPVPHASAIKRRHCSRQGCCNRWKCPRKCGLISPSTSLKDCPRWVASR